MRDMTSRRIYAVATATVIGLSIALVNFSTVIAGDAEKAVRRFSRPASTKRVESNSERDNSQAVARPSARKAQRAKLRWKRPNLVRPAVHATSGETRNVVRQVKLEENVDRQARLQLGDPAPSGDGAPPGFEQPFGDEPTVPGNDSPDMPDSLGKPDSPGKPDSTDAPAQIEPPAGDQMQKIPSDDDSLSEPFAMAPTGLNKDCPTIRDLKPIGEITNAIAPKGVSFPSECPLSTRPFESRAWAMTTYTWKASGLCHKPLYFEQVSLERYGHSFVPLLEPVVAGAHFFATVPILPYKMGIHPPWECIYPLGYYRPGSCAPHMIFPFPISLRGALVEGGVATGLVYLIP